MRSWARPLAPSSSPSVGLALLPAAALGASVNRDTETGVLTIVDDDSVAVDDTIVVERVGGTTDQVRGAGLTNDSSDCTTAGAAIDCPLSTSVAVNLGGGNDTLRRHRHAGPDQRRGRAGQR